MFSNPCFAQFVLSLTPSPARFNRGNLQRGAPLKTTPTRRPVCAGFFGEGRQSENAKLSKKKDYENKESSNLVKDSNSGLLNRTAKLSENKPELLKIDLAARRYNRGLPTERVLQLWRRKPSLFGS